MKATLPIDAALPSILASARRGPVVLSATPGSGKTTRVPPALLDTFPKGQAIWILEPRRIAARAAARRVAHELGEGVGETAGYIVRHDRKCGPHTRLVFVTEGILLQRLHREPELEGVACVVLDEVHERHVETDLCLAMLRDVRETLRPELGLVAMSATLEAEAFRDYLDAEHVDVEGTLHEIETVWDQARDDAELHDRVRRACAESLEALDARGEREEGVLVFLPGVREIEKAASALASLARKRALRVLPLHGRLDAAAQDAAIRRHEQRKIVLATNVAESSVTVDGIRAVVDSGLARILRRDPRSGFDRLRVEPISRASAEQRRGRAGRTGPGFCRRLWARGEERMRPAHTDAEILRIELSGPQLAVRAFAGRDVESFAWFEKPPERELEDADRVLRGLGAIDSDGVLQERGAKMLRMPLPPRLARLMLEAEARDCVAEAAALATLLQLPKRHGGSKHGGSRASLLDDCEHIVRGGARDLLDFSSQRVRKDLARGARPRADFPESDLVACLLAAFPDRVGRRREGDAHRAYLATGTQVRMPRGYDADASLFLALDLRKLGEGEVQVTEALALVLDELDPALVEDEELGKLVPKEGRVRLVRRKRYLRLTLQEEALGDAPEEIATPLLRELLEKDVARWIGAQQGLRALQARSAWLQEQLGTSDDSADGEICPTIDDDALAPWLLTLVSHGGSGVRGLPSLAKLDLGALLRARHAAYFARVERDAPRHLRLPSGREAKIDYAAEAGPTVSARVQELYGCAALPPLAGGRAHLLLEILGPNHRPVQLTRDLAGFWERTYPSVRAELRRRYPKHAWPEKPLEAEAERRPQRRRRG